MKEFVSVLKRTKLFSGVGEDGITAMLSCLGARLCTFKKGEYVLRQGEHLDDILDECPDYPCEDVMEKENRYTSQYQIDMNLFERIFRLTHLRNKRKWKSATAIFTGKCERAIIRTKMGSRLAKYNAYEIVYEANGVKRNGWYTFHPLDVPDPHSIAGDKLKIRYRKDKPFIFEMDISDV